MAVPNSFALAAAQMGHDLVVARPAGYELDEELMETVRKEATASGGSLAETTDIEAAFTGAEVIYAKSWGAKQFYGETEKDIAERAPHRPKWIVDEQKMALTNNAIFMHCLPVRRNVIVTDGVIDSPRSVVIDEAKNRLYGQKAILGQLICH
jgi:N-acetylornithine carbamoyltransferase